MDYISHLESLNAQTEYYSYGFSENQPVDYVSHLEREFVPATENLLDSTPQSTQERSEIDWCECIQQNLSDSIPSTTHKRPKIVVSIVGIQQNLSSSVVSTTQEKPKIVVSTVYTRKHRNVKQAKQTVPGLLKGDPKLPTNNQKIDQITGKSVNIETYADMNTLFTSFREMIRTMRKLRNFKIELKRMVNICQIDQLNLRNRIIDHLSLKINGEADCPKIVLDDGLIGFFAETIIGNSERSADLEKIAEFQSDTLLSKYHSQLESCVHTLKARNRTKGILNLNKYQSGYSLIFNESLLRLIKDSIARLESDFEFEQAIYGNTVCKKVFGEYIADMAEISKFKEGEHCSNPESYKCRFSGFANLFRSITNQSSIFKKLRGDDVRESEMFVLTLFTRCKIIYDTCFWIKKAFCPKISSNGYVNKDEDLPLLVLYTFLDFGKVEEFRRMWYP